MDSIIAVVCDFQCQPTIQVNHETLKKMQSDAIEDILVLNRACEVPPESIKTLRGKKAVFAGCPLLEDKEFYYQAAQKLGFTEYTAFDAKTNVFDRYEKVKNVEQVLLQQIEGLSRILSHKESFVDRRITPNRRALVYGSGFSGLTVAAELAEAGIHVDVLETPQDTLSPGCMALLLEDSKVLDHLRERVSTAGKVHFLRPEALKSLTPVDEGFVFVTEHLTIREYGSIVFAPERRENGNPQVGSWNLHKLFSELAAGNTVKGNVVFVIDQEEHTKPEFFRDVLVAAKYLRRKMCAEVCILLRHVRVSVPGAEELYDECRDLGVIFLKYQGTVEIENDHGDFIIRGTDYHTATRFTIEYPDKLILPGTIRLPKAAKDFARSLKVRLISEYYSQPDSLWQLQNDSNRAGVFVAGAARGNMDATSIQEDAASLVYSLRQRLSSEGIPVEEHIPVVDEEKCAFCLTCVRVCPSGAMTADSEDRVAAVVKSACHACGNCAAECPAGAIELRNISDQAIQESIQILMR